MLVRFIAHAGICIEEDDQSILIDPWFTDSTIDGPVLHSIGGGHATIDFQLPRATDSSSAFRPDLILLSHFHAHHSNRHDIIELVSQTSSHKPVQVAFPDVADKAAHVAELLRPYPRAAAKPLKSGDNVTTSCLEITCLEHTVQGHLAWIVRSRSGCVLHIADAALNRDNTQRCPDTLWSRFAGTKPDIAFISAGGNSLRKSGDPERRLIESVILSPIEAAQVLVGIQPRASVLIGCYNHSIWRNRAEYIPPASLIEDQFEWAHTWLLPSAKVIRARPGHTFGVGDSALAERVDSFLPRA